MNIYTRLENIYQMALKQASVGKGAERHGENKPFEQQDIVTESIELGLAYPIGQARKKAKEALQYTLPHKGKAAAVAELLGAINYLAGAIVAIEQTPEEKGELFLRHISVGDE